MCVEISFSPKDVNAIQHGGDFSKTKKSKPLTAQTNNTITSMTHRRRTQQNRRARNRAARLHNDAFAAAFNNLDAEAEAAAEGNLQAEQGAEGPGAALLSSSNRRLHPNNKTQDLLQEPDLCQWFLNWGTVDGVFAYCYLVLTWNLCCRVKSTSFILFQDMCWTTFDSFEIFFAHTKGDQLGDEAKYSRHCYANPIDVLVSPVFALSLYLTCCFQTERTSARNIYDLKFLCGYIRRRCEAKGVYNAVHAIATVDAMYREIEEEFSVRQRDAQKRWRTFVSQLQRLPPEERQQGQGRRVRARHQ
jgi:hypothetical protein